MEHHHLQWIYPLNMVIFHSYVQLPEGSTGRSEQRRFQHGLQVQLTGRLHLRTNQAPCGFQGRYSSPELGSNHLCFAPKNGSFPWFSYQVWQHVPFILCLKAGFTWFYCWILLENMKVWGNISTSIGTGYFEPESYRSGWRLQCIQSICYTTRCTQQ